jgi:hypothetical protein
LPGIGQLVQEYNDRFRCRPQPGFLRYQLSNGTIAKPVALDRDVKCSGMASMRITSDTRSINSINKSYVRLKPNTNYTLIAWAKTDDISGEPGAQVYPYEFEGAGGQNMMTWTGTKGWSEQRVVLRTGDDGEGRINLRMYGTTDTVWFDDVRLLEGVTQSATRLELTHTLRSRGRPRKQ